jgi:single-strand DNA-binding protein
MSGEGTITLVGNATADAEIRFGASGTARCTWTLAVTPRVKQNDAWTDGETGFYRCTAWRQLAESAGESIVRGMRLVVVGRLSPRTYEKDGEKRVSLDVEVEHVGAEMRYSNVSAVKAERSGTPPHGRSGTSSAPANDPWASSPEDSMAPF